MATKSEKLLWKLRLLDQHQLRAVRRRHDWCTIDSFSNKTDFTRRLRDSVVRQVENRNFTYDEFDEYLLKDIVKGSGHKTSTRIQNVLESTTISDVATRHDVNEELWSCAQAYGALQNEFDSPSLDNLPEQLQTEMSYVVTQEYGAFGQSVDLHVANESRREEYLIEAKLVENISSAKHVIQQVKKYNQLFDHREQTIVYFLYKDEDELEDLKQHRLDNKSLLKPLEGMPKTDWVANHVGRV